MCAVITDIGWSYIAGFLDGEGSITFAHRGKSVRVSVSQAYPEVLDWLVERKLGHIFQDEVQYESGYKTRFRWAIQSKQQVWRFLMHVEPHLILKRSQAQLALKVLAEERHATPEEIQLMKDLKRPPRISRALS